MTYLTRILAFTLLLLGIAQQAQAACPTCGNYGNSMVMGQALVTRSYRVQPGFCAQQLVCMVASAVPAPGQAAKWRMAFHPSMRPAIG